MTRAEWISIAALAVSIAGFLVQVFFHWKHDNERFGRVMEKLGIDE